MAAAGSSRRPRSCSGSPGCVTASTGWSADSCRRTRLNSPLPGEADNSRRVATGAAKGELSDWQQAGSSRRRAGTCRSSEDGRSVRDHFDAQGTSRHCFRVLHDLRGLSVHFMLDFGRDHHTRRSTARGPPTTPDHQRAFDRLIRDRQHRGVSTRARPARSSARYEG